VGVGANRHQRVYFQTVAGDVLGDVGKESLDCQDLEG
jgi:hypothetical protein